MSRPFSPTGCTGENTPVNTVYPIHSSCRILVHATSTAPPIYKRLSCRSGARLLGAMNEERSACFYKNILFLHYRGDGEGDGITKSALQAGGEHATRHRSRRRRLAFLLSSPRPENVLLIGQSRIMQPHRYQFPLLFRARSRV